MRHRLAAFLAVVGVFGAMFVATAPAAHADVDSGWFDRTFTPPGSNFTLYMEDRVVWDASSGVRRVWYGNQVETSSGDHPVDTLGIWVRSLPNGTWVRKWYTENPAWLDPSKTFGVDVTVAGSDQVHEFKTRVYITGVMREGAVIDN